MNKVLDSNTVHTTNSLLAKIITTNRQSVVPTKPVPLDLRDAIGVSKFVFLPTLSQCLIDDTGQPVAVNCSFILATWPM